MKFDPNTNAGFQKGEIAKFGVDIDPNSIVGIPQKPIDENGVDPRFSQWDIGGVSGAELVGTQIEVLFTDGTRASGQLMSDGSQGGAVAKISQAMSTQATEIIVNGTPEGGSGTYGSTNEVIISGPAGQTARVMLMTGFAQPFDYVDPNGQPISIVDRLAASSDPFGANNALEVQVINVTLTGGPQNITSLLDFTPPGGTLAFPGNSALPIAIVSAVVDAQGQPIGPVSEPIYLQKEAAPSDTAPPTASIALGTVSSSSSPMTVTVTYADNVGLDPTTLSVNDLKITTSGPAINILSSSLQIDPDGLKATATYSVVPSAGWTSTPVAFSVAGGAVTDTSGNPNAAKQANFAFQGGSGSTPVDSLADMTQLALQGVSLNNPTSIDVGVDGRLYVSQQDGLIVALTIQKTATTDSQGLNVVTWSVTDREDINLVKDMPNHNDVGIYQPTLGNRQVTGLLTTTDATGSVVIYVTSSDPRIGGGGSGTDKSLDTNSGILSRLSQVDDGSGNLVWTKVDLVRGLPRSEENHSTNGIVLHTDEEGHKQLLIAVGGNTNEGAQSNNFAYTPEYYYSASVIGVDLTALEALEQSAGVKTYAPAGRPVQKYIYDLPTLDDITRPNGPNGDLAGDGTATADVFGGNDGLNQAIYDPNGYVKVLYTGFRNNYDLVVTASGAVYTVDNGSNTGWGGATLNAQGKVLVDSNGDGIADNGPGINLPNNSGSANADSLFRIDDDINAPDAEIFYGGHPNLFRAYGIGAGVYLYAAAGNPWGVAAGTPLGFQNGAITPVSSPVDLAGLIPNGNLLTGLDANGNPIVDPQQAVLVDTNGRQQGLTDAPNGALYTWYSSTNGIDEYTAAGQLQGSLITVSFDGKIYAVKLGPDGEVASVESRALTSSPLDVIAQGTADPYPGVIFVAAYGSDQIVILSPDESQGVTPNPNDRDGDGIDDTIDPFAADPENGLADVITPGAVLRWSFVNGESFPNDRDTMFDGTGGLFPGGDIGFTGIMTNRGGLPESLHEQPNIIWGGAPGVLQVKSVDAGDATTNTQRNGFQLGVTPGAGIDHFTVTSLIDNFLDEIGDLSANEKLSQGIFLGSGDQDNFVSVSLVRLADGRVGFEVESQFAFAFVGATEPQIDFYQVQDLANAGVLDTLKLGLDVTTATGSVVPTWTYRLGTTETSGSGTAILLHGDALAALQASLTLPNDSGGQVPVGLAVGVVSSRSDSVISSGAPVIAISAGGDETFSTTINGTAVTFVPDTKAPNVTIVGTTKVYQSSESISIPNSNLDELYTEERYAASDAPWGYSIETGNGEYIVDLYFAETWSGAFASSARVFDVLVEGALVANNLDIFTVAGGKNLETVVSTTATVTDGVLDILFSKEVQNAKVNAVLVREAPNTGIFVADWDDLEIRGYGQSPADTTPPTASISLTGGVAADDPVQVRVVYSDPSLDLSTVDLSDLLISDPDAQILDQTLQISADNTSATATYFVLPNDGWTESSVNFSVGEDAVTDTSGNGNAPVQVNFTFQPQGEDELVFALNAGGGEFTASNGATYQADNFGAGNKYSTTKPIANTVDDTLYNTETWREGGFTYDVAVQDGIYRVELHFAEIFDKIDSAGERVFDLLIEDSLVFDDLDIFEQSGGQYTALTLETMVAVTDGSLTISTEPGTQNPKIAGFAIWDPGDVIFT